MNCFETRLLTFHKWEGKHSPTNLAKAGFFAVHSVYQKDLVKCFHCGVELVNWHPLDDPIHDHLSANPCCEFINLLYRYLHQNCNEIECRGYYEVCDDKKKMSSGTDTVH